MKAQMREANKLGVETVVIVGDDEIERGEAVVREMATGEQRNIPFDDLVRVLTDTHRTND